MINLFTNNSKQIFHKDSKVNFLVNTWQNLIKESVLIVSLLIIASVNSYATLPANIGTNTFYKKGYLDVSLYDVHNTNITIATAAIQTAVDDAQANKLVCYFPSGNYSINNTIEGLMPMTWNSSISDYVTDRRMPVCIVGANPRPVITLAANSTGYNDQANPKPMFLISAYSELDDVYQSNIAFNLVFRNIDLNLNGTTNTGAVGLDFCGAQGSTIEDVKITATNAYSGFMGAPGQGGGTYNVEVIGGKHAWDLYDIESKFVTMIGITCTNQTAEIIRINPSSKTQRPMLISGFSFKKSSTNPIITSWPTAGGVSLVDGIIEYTGTTASYAFPVPSNNLYLKNVYLKNCNYIVSASAGSALTAGSWTKVSDYRYTGANSSCLIDGATIGANTSFIAKTDNVATPVATTFTSKHIAWDSSTFISVEDASDTDFVDVVNDTTKMASCGGVVNATDAIDDYSKLQAAINTFDKVFLPKGTYYISQTLVLKSNTQLLGAGKTYSVIRPVTSSWVSTKTMITTEADANARTSMSFLMFETNPTIYQDMSRITWLAGRNSMIRDIMIGGIYSTSDGFIDHHLLKLSGTTAGGSFYGFASENNSIKRITRNANYRAVKIDNTVEPIRFYGYNSERIYSDIQFEINGASDIEIYYFKSEANATNGQAFPLEINNSDNVMVYCLAGNLDIRSDRGLIEVNNSTNVLVSTIKSSHIVAGCYNLKEFKDPSTYSVVNNTTLNIFHRIGKPTGPTPQTFCSGASIANLVANGTEIKWWNALANGTQYTNLATALVNNQHYYASQTVFGNTSARLDVTAIVNSVPAQPSTITGATSPCQGSSQTYSVTNVAGVSYAWTLPAGWSQTAGGTTNSITVTVGTGSGNITVTPSNPCNGTARNLAVTVSPLPSCTEPISTSVVYPAKAYLSVVASNTTSYQWQYFDVSQTPDIWVDAAYHIPGNAGYNGSHITADMGVNYLTVGTYTYRCALTNSCGTTYSGSATITVDSSLIINPNQPSDSSEVDTAVSELSANKSLSFNVFPNPSAGMYELVMKGASQTAKYKVFTIDGKELRNGNVINGKASFNLTDAKSGMYMLKLMDEMNVNAQKLIIKE